MSEKRFVIGDDNIALFEVIDMEKEELVCECRAVDVENVLDLLNSLSEENEQLQKKYDNLYSAIEKTARDMNEKMIYEMEDFDVFQRITDYVEELDE